MPLLDDYKKQEHIDGVIYNMSPSADFRHGTANLNIYYCIRNQLKDSLCMVFVENLDWKFDKDKDEYVIPDVMIICDRNNIHKGQYHGIPKFIVETLSPSTALKDKTIKKEIYAQKGVDEYWIIDARAHSLDIYHLKDGHYILSNTYLFVADENDEDYNADKGIFLKVFPHIKITLADIFENT